MPSVGLSLVLIFLAFVAALSLLMWRHSKAIDTLKKKMSELRDMDPDFESSYDRARILMQSEKPTLFALSAAAEVLNQALYKMPEAVRKDAAAFIYPDSLSSRRTRIRAIFGVTEKK